jgi:hypothetical protein
MGLLDIRWSDPAVLDAPGLIRGTARGATPDANPVAGVGQPRALRPGAHW